MSLCSYSAWGCPGSPPSLLLPSCVSLSHSVLQLPREDRVGWVLHCLLHQNQARKLCNFCFCTTNSYPETYWKGGKNKCSLFLSAESRFCKLSNWCEGIVRSYYLHKIILLTAVCLWHCLKQLNICMSSAHWDSQWLIHNTGIQSTAKDLKNDFRLFFYEE